jgi:antitoxin Phd
MKHKWQLQEAKNKLSGVIDEAAHHGPQVITRRDVEVAVIFSYADYRKITGTRRKLSVFFSRIVACGH